MWVCVCTWTHTHTHTHIPIFHLLTSPCCGLESHPVQVCGQSFLASPWGRAVSSFQFPTAVPAPCGLTIQSHLAGSSEAPATSSIVANNTEANNTENFPVVQWLRIHCQCRWHGFSPWSRKIPHAVEQLSPCITANEPTSREAISIREAPEVRRPHTSGKSSPCSLRPEKAHMQQLRPSKGKNKWH